MLLEWKKRKSLLLSLSISCFIVAINILLINREVEAKVDASGHFYGSSKQSCCVCPGGKDLLPTDEEKYFIEHDEDFRIFKAWLRPRNRHDYEPALNTTIDQLRGCIERLSSLDKVTERDSVCCHFKVFWRTGICEKQRTALESKCPECAEDDYDSWFNKLKRFHAKMKQERKSAAAAAAAEGHKRKNGTEKSDSKQREVSTTSTTSTTAKPNSDKHSAPEDEKKKKNKRKVKPTRKAAAATSTSKKPKEKEEQEGEGDE